MGTKHHNTASLLWLLGLIGLCGLHRIYLNRKATGVIWLLTFGLYGLGQLYDMFTLKEMVSESNTKFLSKVNKYSSPGRIYFFYAPTFNSLPAKDEKCEYCSAEKASNESCKNCGAT